MTGEQAEEISRRWTPDPENIPQQQAYESDADELFFGGSPGGGKTDLGLGLALTRHSVSQFFRRQATQLDDAIERAKEIANWGSDPFTSYNGNSKIIRCDGRTLKFAGLDQEGDKQKFKGRAADFKYWDEAVDFLQSQVIFVNAWNRSARYGQRCRVVLGSNPPTTDDGWWLVERYAPWLDPEGGSLVEPGELRWYAMIEGVDAMVDGPSPIKVPGEIELVKPRSRTFIPSTLKDNKFLASTDYLSTLQALPEPLRSQLLFADFSRKNREDHAWQIIPSAWVEKAQARWTQSPPADSHMEALGVDVARGGIDNTTLVARFGRWFAPPAIYPGAITKDGPTVAKLVIAAMEGTCSVNVDGIGVGTSVIDSLRETKIPCHAVIGNAASKMKDRTGKLKMKNVRAAMWWKLREALDPDHGVGLMLPPGNMVKRDLCAPRYSLAAGAIQVESKEELRDAERLGRSTDIGDAICYAWWKEAVGWTSSRENLAALGARLRAR